MCRYFDTLIDVCQSKNDRERNKLHMLGKKLPLDLGEKKQLREELIFRMYGPFFEERALFNLSDLSAEDCEGIFW